MAAQNLEPDPIHFTDAKDKIDEKNPLLLGAFFLFFVFFTTFLFLYFLYVGTHRRRATGGAAANPARSTPGLDTATIRSLPMFSYGFKNSSPESECAICLSTYQEGEKVKVLPICHHGFHSECVDKWLCTRPSCPLCRASIHRVDSV